MHTLMKYGLKSFVGLIFSLVLCNEGSSATSAKDRNCKTAVGMLCSSDTTLCRKYCQLKDIADCDCSTTGEGLCAFSVEGANQNTTDLQKLNHARFIACREETDKKELWKKVNTVQWLLLTASKTEQLKPGELSVRDAVKISETLVRNECINVHAPKYCKVKEVEDCKAQAWCIRIIPKKGEALNDEGSVVDIPTELRAQVEAQLMACIAAKRDPFARKTGRPEYACSTKISIPWCSINAPSWRDKILWPEDADVIKARKDEYNEKVRQAKEDGKDDKWIAKNIDFPKTRGQLKEAELETVICDGGALKSCRGDTPAIQVESEDSGT